MDPRDNPAPFTSEFIIAFDEDDGEQVIDVVRLDQHAGDEQE